MLLVLFVGPGTAFAVDEMLSHMIIIIHVFNIGLDLGAERCGALRQLTFRTVHLPRSRLAWLSPLAD